MSFTSRNKPFNIGGKFYQANNQITETAILSGNLVRENYIALVENGCVDCVWVSTSWICPQVDK